LHWFHCLFLVLTVTLSSLGPAGTVQAQAPPAKTAAAPSTPQQDEPPRKSIWGIIFSGGITGVLIVLVLVALSLLAAALVFEQIMTLKSSVLMPPELALRVRGLLIQGNVAGADEQCRAQPSFLAFVLQAGLSEVESGWSGVEKAMEDALAEQSARLFRRIEYLSVIGNIAPMIGLLGTVVGMVFAFQSVAESQGAARAADLAEGIYTALVTTVAGLLVAIPSLAAFAIFRNRVDQLVSEAAYQAQHVFAPLKRRRSSRAAAQVATGTAPAPPPPPEGGRM